jgi:PAT family beta-lactamase induction signal transducer AmpG
VAGSAPFAGPRGRRFALALLYLSEGAPIGYLWWALPTKLRAAGLPVEQVAALSAILTIPWTFKFLWAPLVDVFRSRRHGVKPWIVGAQALMAATIAPLAFLDLIADYDVIVAMLLAHAFFAATQDAAIDALAVRTVSASERGQATGWMQTGMLTGRAVFGGAALVLERTIGAAGVVAMLVATILCTSGVVLMLDDSGPQVRESLTASVFRVGDRLRRVLTLRATWLGVAFAALAGAAMEATGALAGPLMIDTGLSKEATGRFFAFPAVAAMAAGALIGGRVVDGVRRTRAAQGALLAVAAAVLGVAAATTAAGTGLLLVSLTVVYSLFGVLTAAMYALLMDLTDPASEARSSAPTWRQ